MSELNAPSARTTMLAARRNPGRAGVQVWWLNPVTLLFFIIAPLFTIALSVGSPERFGAQNFLTPLVILAVVGNLLALAAGTSFGARLGSNVQFERMPAADRIIIAIVVTSILSILAHFVLLSELLLKPSLVLRVLSGEKGAIYIAKGMQTRLPGVLSIASLYMVSLALYGALPRYNNGIDPKNIRNLSVVVFTFVVVRAFLMADRLAIIEAAIAFALPRLALQKRVSKWVAWYPAIGFVLVFSLFMAGEYTRSWGYFRYSGVNFFQFGIDRLTAYLATSTNNGAGVLAISGPVYAPMLTADFYYQLPIWDFVTNPLQPDRPVGEFLRLYGNAEYTNPGGFLSPTIDYGYTLGAIVMVIFGFAGGYIFSLYRNKQYFGLITFPLMFIGYLIINQSFYWSNSRAFLPWVATIAIYFLTTQKRAIKL